MKKNITWHIGCSGFHYKEWKGRFYPEGLIQKKWFEYYCTYFNTLELNVTFYRFPKLDFVQAWYNKSPPDFSFAVKAPRLITHYKKFLDSQQLLDDFYGTIKEGLKEKLANVLFQFPGKTEYSAELLQRIIAGLDLSVNNAIEFRNNSWWNEDVFSALRKNNITFCSISIAKLPDTVAATNSSVYYRFHGIPVLFVSAYSSETLKQVADEISSNPAVKTAFIYFNNTASGAAIQNAEWLKEYCTAKPGEK